MSLTALLLLLASPAWAQEEGGYVALLDKAKAAIGSGDYKGARTLLAQAEAAAPTSEALILEKDLARLSFYKGAVEWRNGDKDTAALNHWRSAIVLSQDFQPEADVLPESDAQDVYYALIGEVKGRESVTLGLPEDPGDTMIFVDGRRMEAFDAVVIGTHFVQLRCGEGNVVGSWYTFGAPPPDYLVLCSGGAYPVAKGGKAPKPPKGASKADIAKAEKEAAKQAKAQAALEAAAALAAEKEAAAALAATEKAAAEKAAAEKATADSAAAEKAAAAAGAAAEKAAADKAAGDKAAADKAATDKAATLAAADKAAADSAAALVAAEKAAADKAAADSAAALVAAEKATADKAAGAEAERLAATKAAADKAAADQATVDKAAADKASADKAAADKAAADKASADKTAADKAAADKAAKALAAKAVKPKSTAKNEDSGVVGWAMIAGGGAMIVGGGAVNFLVVNPAWTEVEAANADPRGATRTEADAIVSRFNTGRYATIGLLAAGVATAGVGVFLGPLDSHVYFTPTGVGLAGRW
ncbi:MAG: hypothetical protein Q8P18_26825 [Pseudomonadota bacterium]|nr:hypothetical protein [Pseudomonadota bacterium]